MKKINSKSRVSKWQKMIVQANKSKKRTKEGYLHPKLKERVRKGIPDACRADCWRLLIPFTQLKKQNPGIYDKHKATPSTYAKQIDLDINRTYRDHKLFKERYNANQIKLFNVLKAYSSFNPTVGYCQGMASVCAIILMHIPDEEEVFWFLAHLLADKKLGMEPLFLPGFPRLMECFYMHEQILKERLPAIYKHFTAQGIMTSMYATKWYMLFMLDIVPFDISFRVWDLFLSEGKKVIFSVILSLLRLFEQKLLHMDFEHIMKFFVRELEVSDIDLSKLLKMATKEKVKESRLLRIEQEYQKQNHPQNSRR